MKKCFAVLLSFIMVFSTIIICIPESKVSASGSSLSSDVTAILNQDKTAPYEEGSIYDCDIYGEADNTPFLLSEQNELYAYFTQYDYGNGTSTQRDFYFDNISTETESRGDLQYFKSPNFNNYDENIVSYGNDNTGFSYVTGVGFDPMGSGRKAYAAFVGVKNNDIYVFVQDPKNKKMYSLNLGDAEWTSGAAYFRMANYMTITAGDYDGDGKDSLIVYFPGDKGNVYLYEIKFSGSALTKTQVLDLKTVTVNNNYVTDTTKDIKYKPIVSLTTGDFDGDGTEEFAYSVGFHNTNGNVKNFSVSSLDYFATQVGVGDYSNGKLSTSVVAHMYDQTLNSGSTYNVDLMLGGKISAGDIDGDGDVEIVAVGYMPYTSTAVKSGSTYSVTYGLSNDFFLSYNYAYAVISTTNEGTYTRSDIGKYDTGSGSFVGSNIKKIKEWKHTVWPQIALECVATNGTNQREDVFLGGKFFDLSKGNATVLFETNISKNTFTTVMDDNDDCNYYWIGSTCVGNFDHNDAGREQVVFTVGFRYENSANTALFIGFAGGAEFDDTASSYGECTRYSQNWTRNDYGYYIYDSTKYASKIFKKGNAYKINFAPVALDLDNDGILVKYDKTTYAYTDPEVVAVLQAAPYFSAIDDLGGYDDPCETSYTVTETSGYTSSTGNSVSFGVGISTELEATGLKMSVEAGYSLDWSEEVEKAYETSRSITWSAQYEDIVCLLRTPVVFYCYNIWDEKNSKWITDGYSISKNLPSTSYALSIDDYNTFVDAYNKQVNETVLKKIGSSETPSGNSGNPYAYYGSWSDSNGGKNLASVTTSLGYAGGNQAVAWDTSSETTTSTSISHGFDYSVSAGGSFNAGIVSASVSGYVNLSYGKESGSSTSTGKENEISGQVQNIRAAAVEGMTIDEVKQYGFKWQFGKWERAVYSNGSKVPFFGYVVTDVTSPCNAPENLTAAFTGTEEITNVKLTWETPEAISNGPSLSGYLIYDNGEQINEKIVVPYANDAITYTKDGNEYKYPQCTEEDGKETFIIEGVENGSYHVYTVVALATLGGNVLISGESNEAVIGQNPDEISIESISKDETYTSESGLVDKYIIKMTDGTEYYFYVTNGEDAYEAAVNNGYTGTKEEWLSMLGANCSEGHTYKEYTIDATCRSKGITIKVCEKCGFAEVVEINPLTHSYEKIMEVEPTCTTKGHSVYKCEHCSDFYYADEKSAKNHDYELLEEHEANCINPGFKIYKCKTCDSSYMADYVAALGHDYEKTVTAPTCCQKGYTTYTCKREGCGETHIADITATVDHSFKDKVISNTCITEGYTIHYCENCGYQQIIDEKNAKGHNYEATEIVAPTCTSKGYTIYTCKDCGVNYKGDETDFAAHTPGKWICDDYAAGHYSIRCENCYKLLEEKTVEIIISVNSGDTEISQGDSFNVTYGSSMALQTNANEGDNISFVSSNSSVAEINENGEVVTKGAGTAVITITDNDTGISTSFTVRVTKTWWQKVHEILATIAPFKALFMLFGITY